MVGARTIAAWGVVGAVACGPAPDDVAGPTPIPPDPPTLAEPDGEPWHREGEVGDLAVIRVAPSLHERHHLKVAAVFADDLQGLPFPAACDRLGLLCVPPGAPLEVEVPTDGVSLDPDASRWAWVGDRLGVGPASIPFEVFERRPTGGYAGRFLPGASLPERLDLELRGGEWGDALVEGALPVPAPFEVIEPDPRAPVVLAGEPFARLRWSPVGEGAMLLTGDGPEGRWARWLEDDGAALIDARAWRSSGPVRVGLWHVGPAETIELDGGSLAVTPVAGQSWCVYDTCEPPFAFPASLAFEYCWTTTSCGEARWFLAADGTWSTTDGFVGTWTWDCCGRELSMRFTSGTVYRGVLEEDGTCLQGTMLSWSGNEGVWRGCL